MSYEKQLEDQIGNLNRCLRRACDGMATQAEITLDLHKKNESLREALEYYRREAERLKEKLGSEGE